MTLISVFLVNVVLKRKRSYSSPKITYLVVCYRGSEPTVYNDCYNGDTGSSNVAPAHTVTFKSDLSGTSWISLSF